LLSIEGMAEGKAVVTYLRDEFVPLRPDLPVVSAEPATAYDVLSELVRDPARRAALGAQGPGYVRRYHDTSVVGPQLLAEYRRIPGLEATGA
jgi:hypothetical protein